VLPGWVPYQPIAASIIPTSRVFDASTISWGGNISIVASATPSVRLCILSGGCIGSGFSYPNHPPFAMLVRSDMYHTIAAW
jgi:hypothetical protein